MRNILMPIFLIGLLGACTVENELPNKPEISIVSVHPTEITEYQDVIKVVLAYTDGDGNLGFSNPDSNALRVWDDRLSSPDWYHVQPLAPPGEKISIQGELTVNLSGTFVLSSTADQETTRFRIKIKDRNGNWSNEVITPLITINRE